MAEPLPITNTLVIDGDDLAVERSRSSGPGGQNVNKVETQIRLRFDLEGCEALSDEVRARIRAANPGRITTAGELIIECSTTRSQKRNLEEARERLAEIVRAGLVRPKRRKKTRPSRAAREKRLTEKKQRGETKRGRSKPRGGWDG